ncbi:MAG: hypothetical protein EZS28_032868 [Streblomastix strix]|uniref:SPRY domain-containing protein n=1 Tax=Streblomastix strix TaxID=222440 RepID=A0A5J4UPD4_9EUKA|nr:MAG: hypothetical protein EZS28_032868 [Streblomastix strix]
MFGSTTGADVTTIIPHLIDDIESDNANLHAPSLRQLLEIILDNRESKDLSFKYKLMPLLNKFAGNIEKNEEFVLSTTILHVIGVRNGSDDKTILAGAAIDSIIHSLFSGDEKTSKSGRKALCELIEENEIIRHSLMRTGFISKVQYAFINSSQSSSSSSSSQTEITTPYHVKCGLLDIVLKLVATVVDLQQTSILIPILTELKNNGEIEIKNKSLNILGIQSAKGINSTSSYDTKEKDDEIKQFKEGMERKEEELRRKEEELRRKDEELQRERRRADEAEQRIRRLESEKKQEKQEKEKKEPEMKKLKDENENLKSNQKQQIVKPVPKTSQDLPIAIHYINSGYQDFSDINGVMKKLTQKQNYQICYSLTQVMENGIWDLEAQFNTTQYNGAGALGIVQDTFNIPVGCGPNSNSCTAFFCGKAWSGRVCVKTGDFEAGNAGFTNNQIIKIEFDSGKGTLHLFVDGAQQPNYISGINEKVRFVIYMYYFGSTCTFRSLKKLLTPTVGHLPNEKALQW